MGTLINGSLFLLIGSHLKRFAPLKSLKSFLLAFCAFQFENDLFGSFGLFLKNGLSLASESLLLHVVSSSSQGRQSFLSLFVLTDLVHGMLLAFVAAVGFPRFGDVHHFAQMVRAR